MTYFCFWGSPAAADVMLRCLESPSVAEKNRPCNQTITQRIIRRGPKLSRNYRTKRHLLGYSLWHVLTCKPIEGNPRCGYTMEAYVIDHRHSSFGIDSSSRSLIRILQRPFICAQPACTRCPLHVRTCTLVGCYPLWWHTIEVHIIDLQLSDFGIDRSRRSIIRIFLVEVP